MITLMSFLSTSKFSYVLSNARRSIYFCHVPHRRTEDGLGFVEILSADLSPRAPQQPKAKTQQPNSRSATLSNPTPTPSASRPAPWNAPKSNASASSSTSTPTRSGATMGSLRDLYAQITDEVKGDRTLTPAQNVSKSRTKSMKAMNDKKKARKTHSYPSGRGEVVQEEESSDTELLLALIPYTVRSDTRMGRATVQLTNSHISCRITATTNPESTGSPF